MREFYKKIIAQLYIYCGNRQADKMTDDELKTLLDALCRVSVLYSYIPEQDQIKIIEKCLLEDKEYQNINARLISKWLETNGKKFFVEEAHKETKEYEPATPEQREQRLKEWEAALAKVDNSFSVRPVSNAELMRERLHGADPKPTWYKPMTDQEVNARELHRLYIAANYDKLTGNALETWLPEDEWIKKNV